jgi:hypothetical protein
MLNPIINRLKNKAFLFSLYMYIILVIDGNDEACYTEKSFLDLSLQYLLQNS